MSICGQVVAGYATNAYKSRNTRCEMTKELTSKQKEEYITKLFPNGEPLIFKMLIEDAIEHGRQEEKNAVSKESEVELKK